MFYHRNRLIKAYEKLGYQKQAGFWFTILSTLSIITSQSSAKTNVQAIKSPLVHERSYSASAWAQLISPVGVLEEIYYRYLQCAFLLTIQKYLLEFYTTSLYRWNEFLFFFCSFFFVQPNDLGIGVVGVVTVDFLKPIHNKQDFEKDEKYK